MKYPCPRGCKLRVNYEDSLRSWKAHMTRMHGGFSDSELQAVVEPPDTSFETLAAAAPETETPAPAEAGEASEQSAAPAPAPSVPVPRRVKAVGKKFRAQLAEIPARLLSSVGIAITEAERESIQEAFDFLGDVFGVEFEVASEPKVIRSKLIALAYPILVVVGVLFAHREELAARAKQPHRGNHRPERDGENNSSVQ